MKKNIKRIFLIVVAMLTFLLFGLTGFASETNVYSVTIHWSNQEEWDLEELQNCILINNREISLDQITIEGNNIHITGLTKEDQISFRPSAYGFLGSDKAETESVAEVELKDEEVPLANMRIYHEGSKVVEGELDRSIFHMLIIVSLFGVSIILCTTGLFTLASEKNNKEEW